MEDGGSSRNSRSAILSIFDLQPAAVVHTSALTWRRYRRSSRGGGAAAAGRRAASERLVSNPRHRDAAPRGRTARRDQGYARGVPADLLTVDMTTALSALGEITGDGVHDDLLAAIFRKFCIGK